MFCIECGYKNPDRAKFCANCGAQLIFKKPEEKHPEPAPAEKPVRPELTIKAVLEETEEPEMPFPVDADAPYRRPAAPGSRRARREEAERRQTVEPLESNPAQPVQPKTDEWESAQDRFRRTFDREEPPKTETAAKPEEPVEDVKPEQKPHTVINSDGETVPEPKRMSLQQERRSSTYVPKRNPLSGFDAFLDDDDEEENTDAGEKESFVEKHLRSIITLILAAVAVLAVILVLLSPLGKKMLYENGKEVNVTAATYAGWAAGYEKEMKYARAADAYHQALILEPDNYGYAMKIAENSIESMDYLQAYKALRTCMSLDGTQKMPFQMMHDIYPNLPANEKKEAEGILYDAARKTFGDAALLP